MTTQKVIQVIGYLQKNIDQYQYNSDAYKKIQYIYTKQDFITYQEIKKVKKLFIDKWNFTCENQTFYLRQHNQQLHQLINCFSKYSLSSLNINSKGQYVFPIVIKSISKIMCQQICRLKQQINKLNDEVKFLKSQHQQQNQNFQIYNKSADLLKSADLMRDFEDIDLPFNKKLSLMTSVSKANVELDLGFLFSQPIYDPESNRGNAGPPVGYRSQIKRIQSAIKSGSIGSITMKCQRATILNLVNFIKNQSPKILHISCHGQKDGRLDFQEDSLLNLGKVRKVSGQTIIKQLSSYKLKLPKLAFINTCYSQKFGRALLALGVESVIAINSKCPINDQAAEVFSQHFYSMIFKGGFSIPRAFESAKNQVRQQKFDNSGLCCCYHEVQHDGDCVWAQISKRQPYQAHNIYHSNKQCSCPRKYFNQHQIKCSWAKKTLFFINKNFKIDSDEGPKIPSSQQIKQKNLYFINKDSNQKILMICCGCKVKHDQHPPHGQSKKFILLTNNQVHEPFYSVSKISKGIVNQITDFTAAQFLQTNQNLPKNLMGRQTNLYQFFRVIKNPQGQRFFTLTGAPGSGKSIFIHKAGAYMLQRKDIQAYFYINLYKIDDQKQFRHMLYQATKIQIGNSISYDSFKFRKYFIVLDNTDQFIKSQNQKFFWDLDQLKRNLKFIKVVLIMQTQQYSSLNSYQFKSQNFNLGPLGVYEASKIIFLKLKSKLSYQIKFPDIQNIVEQKSSLRLPTIIDNFCQIFNSARTINKTALKQKVAQIIDKQLNSKQLIQQNFRALKKDHPNSYLLFLFISQFIDGVSLNDLHFLSQYPLSSADIKAFPITKNWIKDLQVLGQNMKIQMIKSSPQNSQKGLDYQKWNISISSSYFLNKAEQGKVVVKKYLRQYIWYEHNENLNFQMKYLFVSYMYVMLQVMFNIYKKEHYVHQQQFAPSALSQTGIFQIKTSLPYTYQKSGMTRSIEIGAQAEKILKNIIFSNQNFMQKIHIRNPSQFIQNHKQQLINIYKLKFEDVFNYLSQTQNSRYKVFICYLQNLMISIPTAMIIANSQLPFQQYLIGKSLDYLNKIRLFLIQKIKQNPQKFKIIDNYLITFVKLNLMKISVILKQKTDISSNQLNNIFQNMDSIVSATTLNQAQQKKFMQLKASQKQFTQIYKEKVSVIDVNDIIKKINHKLEYFENNENDVLKAKQGLLLVQIFQKFYSQNQQMSRKMPKVDQNHIQNALKVSKHSWKVLDKAQRWKLSLRLRCSFLNILWMSKINAIKDIQSCEESLKLINQFKETLKESQSLFKNKTYKLRGFSEFQSSIHSLKTLIDKKQWQLSKNTMVFMRAAPLYRQNSQIYENLVKKSHNFRREIQRTFKKDQIQDTDFDILDDDQSFQMIIDQNQSNKRASSQSNFIKQKTISVKFQVLTKQKLRNQSRLGISILVLTVNFRLINDQLFMITQNQLMQESLIPINQDFPIQFDLDLIKIMIVFGQQSQKFILKIKQLMKNPPIMIGLSYEKGPKITRINKQILDSFVLIKTIRTQIQIIYIKHLISKLKKIEVSEKQDLLNIHKQAVNIIRNQPHTDMKLRPIFQFENSLKIKLNFIGNHFKNLSPDVSNFYNVQLNSNQQNTFYILRRKQEIRKVLLFASKQMHSKDVAYLNLYGQRKSGKTYFAEELVRIFVQRQFYSGGVFMIRGDVVQNTYHGDLQKYIQQKSLTGSLPNLQYFMKCQQRKIMFIIDDFNLITPKSRAQFDFCFEKIKRLGINLIIITNYPYKNDSKLPNLYQIKLNKISEKQFNTLSSKTFEKTEDKIQKDQKKEQENAQRPNSLSHLLKVKSQSPSIRKKSSDIQQSKTLKLKKIPILKKENEVIKKRNIFGIDQIFNFKPRQSPHR